jgi:hypothetical protein
MRTGIVAVVIAATLGCGQARPYVEVPATPPKLGDVAYLPTFTFEDGEEIIVGTAFVVQARHGARYVLMVARLFERSKWATVRSVSLVTMSRRLIGHCEGPALFLNTRTNAGAYLREADLALVVWRLAPGDSAEPLPLARRMPNTNRLWVVGNEDEEGADQKTYECKPGQALGPLSLFTAKQPFQMGFFHGAPIVNSKGEAVANFLDAGGGLFLANPVENIREALAGAGIDVE